MCISVIIDEYAREGLSLLVVHRIRAHDDLDQLYELFQDGTFRNTFIRTMPRNLQPKRLENGKSWVNDPVHQARQSMGGWLCGMVHWKI